MSARTAVETIQAAIEKLEALKAESTQGEWFWEPPSKDEWPHGDEGLSATHGLWKVCEYYCRFDESSGTSRGASGKPGHEHLETKSVLSGWGYDASGIHGSAADRELILVLHRTIDAQLKAFNSALWLMNKDPLASGHAATYAIIGLARAILGEES